MDPCSQKLTKTNLRNKCKVKVFKTSLAPSCAPMENVTVSCNVQVFKALYKCGLCGGESE